jgi:2-dehydro-3-deoxyphosphooctonate aldolase (KDO 8-P synthase)
VFKLEFALVAFEVIAVTVRIADIELGSGRPLVVIAGPCIIESWEMLYQTAAALVDLARELNFPLVFKASFDKANRTSYESFRGPGMDFGLEMLAEIKKKLNVPILSDVHEAAQCSKAGDVLDVIQVPAFLCRQTDITVAAARTMKTVNIKKGQFVAPLDILQSVIKVTREGNQNVFVTERGITFGYNNLVVDFRSIPIIQAHGCPVVFDATHSVQLPGAAGSSSGGQRRFIPTLAKAAIAAGCQGLFMEVHPNPEEALSDPATQIPLSYVRDLLRQCLEIHRVVQAQDVICLPENGQCTQPTAV